MIVDTAQFRALVDERDQARAEAVDTGRIRRHVLDIAGAVAGLCDHLAGQSPPVPPKVVTGGRPRHARPRGSHLSVVQGGQQ